MALVGVLVVHRGLRSDARPAKGKAQS